MDLNTYKNYTKQTAFYPKKKAIEYLSLGLTSEAGEVAGVVKKMIRDNIDPAIAEPKLKKEIGDVFWYLIRLCDELDCNPEEILDLNIKKLLDRQQRNKLSGDGDDR